MCLWEPALAWKVPTTISNSTHAILSRKLTPLPVFPTGTSSQSVEPPPTQSSGLNLTAPLSASLQPFTNVFWWSRTGSSALLPLYLQHHCCSLDLYPLFLYCFSSFFFCHFLDLHVSGSPHWAILSPCLWPWSFLSPLTTSQTPPHLPGPSLFVTLSGHPLLVLTKLWALRCQSTVTVGQVCLPWGSGTVHSIVILPEGLEECLLAHGNS